MGEFLRAVTLLLSDVDPSSVSPTIQKMQSCEGFNAFDGSPTMSTVLQMKSFERSFVVCVHSDGNFDGEAIANLAIGYFGATDISYAGDDGRSFGIDDDVDDLPTVRITGRRRPSGEQDVQDVPLGIVDGCNGIGPSTHHV